MIYGEYCGVCAGENRGYAKDISFQQAEEVYRYISDSNDEEYYGGEFYCQINGTHLKEQIMPSIKLIGQDKRTVYRFIHNDYDSDMQYDSINISDNDVIDDKNYFCKFNFQNRRFSISPAFQSTKFDMILTTNVLTREVFTKVDDLLLVERIVNKLITECDKCKVDPKYLKENPFALRRFNPSAILTVKMEDRTELSPRLSDITYSRNAVRLMGFGYGKFWDNIIMKDIDRLITHLVRPDMVTLNDFVRPHYHTVNIDLINKTFDILPDNVYRNMEKDIAICQMLLENGGK